MLIIWESFWYLKTVGQQRVDLRLPDAVAGEDDQRETRDNPGGCNLPIPRQPQWQTRLRFSRRFQLQ